MSSTLPGDTIWEEFTTENASGAATNADVLPIATLIRNGTDTPVSLSVSNVDAGRYLVTGMIPSNYNAGDRIQILISAIIGSVTSKGILSLGALDSKRIGDLNDSSPAPTASDNAMATATAILATPGNRLATDAAGRVTAGVVADKTGYQLDLTQPVPTTNTDNSTGDCLNAARAQGFGKWVKSDDILTLFAPDGTTVVRTFQLNDALAPTMRS